jgi:hypothetical protein
VHANFEAVYRRLDKAYQKYFKLDNEKITGGIVWIYAKMCADSILRDKLFAKGQKLDDDCSIFGLQVNIFIFRFVTEAHTTREY